MHTIARSTTLRRLALSVVVVAAVVVSGGPSAASPAPRGRVKIITVKTTKKTTRKTTKRVTTTKPKTHTPEEYEQALMDLEAWMKNAQKSTKSMGTAGEKLAKALQDAINRNDGPAIADLTDSASKTYAGVASVSEQAKGQTRALAAALRATGPSVVAAGSRAEFEALCTTAENALVQAWMDFAYAAEALQRVASTDPAGALQVAKDAADRSDKHQAEFDAAAKALRALSPLASLTP